MNADLGLPASVRAMGYAKTDVDRMVARALRSYFNVTAPRQPTHAEYERLVLEVLG
jgi:alcohol dehydrogenase class IV